MAEFPCIEDLNQPLVISYETNLETNDNSLMFKKTLDDLGWKYVFVGEGCKWNGFKSKIFGYTNYLKTLPQEKIIILSDARDVFACRSPHIFKNVINDIVNIKNKFIVSAELFLIGHINWTEEEIAKKKSIDSNYFWQGETLTNYWKYIGMSDNLPKRKYVNSGLMIGKARQLLDAFEWFIENNFTDDQLGLAKYINTFPNKVHLDTDAKYLHTCTMCVSSGYYDSEFQNYDSVTVSELLGMSSYFLHIPGLNMSKGQNKLYYTIKKNISDELIKPFMILNEYSDCKDYVNKSSDYFPKLENYVSK